MIILLFTYLVRINIAYLSRITSVFFRGLSKPSVWAGRTHEQGSTTREPPSWWCNNKALYMQRRVMLFQPSTVKKRSVMSILSALFDRYDPIFFEI